MMDDRKTIDELIEIQLGPEGLLVRIDLQQGTVTTAFKDWFSWHWDTVQKRASDNLILFIEPDDRIVGTCSIPGGGSHE